MFNQPLTTIEGVVASSASDWALNDVLPVFSITMSTFGIFSAVLGSRGFFEKFGPRVTSMTGAGLMMAAYAAAITAISTQSLPLLCAGFGGFGGLAIATAYVPTLANLLRWFPDRKGFAAALGVVGFGAGGAVAAPLIGTFLEVFSKAPQYIGTTSEVSTIFKNGKTYVDLSTLTPERLASIPAEIINKKEFAFENLHEVVSATAQQISTLPASLADTLHDGFYLVGTGSTGLIESLLCLGGVYATTMLVSSLAFRLPPPGYNPAAKKATNLKQAPVTTPVDVQKEDVQKDAAPIAASLATPAAPTTPMPRFDHVALSDVHPSKAFKTRQFWTLWLGICANATSSYAIIGTAKTMITDMFAGNYPHIVTSSFAGSFIAALSLSNLSGRIIWGTISDKIGTKSTFSLLYGLSVPLYLMPILATALLPVVGSMDFAALAQDPATMTLLESVNHYAPITIFYGSIMLAISCFGGCAAVTAAYIADLFGTKHVAANQGQLLSYLLLGGFLGPFVGAILRGQAENNAITDLVSKLDPSIFQSTFGAPIEKLDELIEAKAVTISKLLEMFPPGTVTDPSPYIYQNVFIFVASMQLFVFLLNTTMKRVNPKLYEQAISTITKPSQHYNVANAIASPSPVKPAPSLVTDSRAPLSTQLHQFKNLRKFTKPNLSSKSLRKVLNNK